MDAAAGLSYTSGMRASLLILAILSVPTAAMAARPLHVRLNRAHQIGRAERYIARNHLLTPEQLACATIVPGKLGSARVSQISVFEQHGLPACPGDATPPTFLFDLYVDTVSGVVDYTPDEQGQLQTILPFIPAED